MIDPARCLERIRFRGNPQPDAETLAGLQRQFLLHIPFENLDIHLDRPITLSPDRIYDKIVGKGRGGFCYECNSLFHAMLAASGFRVSYHGAKMLIEGSRPLDFGHMVLVVQLDYEYLVDVGNGQSCREPLRLDGGNSAVSEGIEYRAGDYGGDLALYYRIEGQDWKPRFSFTSEVQTLDAFEQPCRIQQVSPESRFTRHRLASMATPGGRITLLDGELTFEEGDQHEVVQIQSADDYGRALAEHFGIHLPEEAVETLFGQVIRNS